MQNGVGEKRFEEGDCQRKMRLVGFGRSGTLQRMGCVESEKQCGVRKVMPGEERYGADGGANAQSSQGSMHTWGF